MVGIPKKQVKILEIKNISHHSSAKDIIVTNWFGMRNERIACCYVLVRLALDFYCLGFKMFGTTDENYPKQMFDSRVAVDFKPFQSQPVPRTGFPKAGIRTLGVSNISHHLSTGDIIVTYWFRMRNEPNTCCNVLVLLGFRF